MGLISQLFYFYYISYKIEYNFMIYLDNTTEGQIIFIPRNDQKIEEIKPIPEDILGDYYTKAQSNDLFATKTELNSVNEEINNSLNELNEKINLSKVYSVSLGSNPNAMQHYMFNNIAWYHTEDNKPVQVNWVDDNDNVIYVDIIRYDVNIRPDDVFYGTIYGANCKWECDIDGNITYTDFSTSSDIEVITLLNFQITQEQVNYLCENYGTKNIVLKGQFEDEDTFEWLDLIKFRVYGKEDDGNWLAMIGVADGVYRYFFDAEKVFNENDELVWQISREVEDIYEPTVKDVLINDLSTLDGKFRNIEVLLDYGNVVNILNGTQTIYVLNTKEEVINGTIMTYIFGIGSNSNNDLVKYMWKRQNGNIIYSSEVIGGGSNDIVYFDFDIEDGEFNKNDDFNFKRVAQALKENKIVYVNGYLVTSYHINDNLVTGYVSIVDSSSVVIYDASFANFLQNTVRVNSQWFTIPNEDDMIYIYDELDNINERVTILENNGGTGGGGSPTYVVGLETVTSMNATKFNEIANEYVNESKEVQIFWANNDATFTTVDVIEVKVDYRDDETYYGVISALNDKWECDINGNVTYTEIYYDDVLRNLRKDLEDLSAEEEDDINKVNAQIKNLQDQIDAIILRLQNNNIN